MCKMFTITYIPRKVNKEMLQHLTKKKLFK